MQNTQPQPQLAELHTLICSRIQDIVDLQQLQSLPSSTSTQRYELILRQKQGEEYRNGREAEILAAWYCRDGGGGCSRVLFGELVEICRVYDGDVWGQELCGVCECEGCGKYIMSANSTNSTNIISKPKKLQFPRHPNPNPSPNQASHQSPNPLPSPPSNLPSNPVPFHTKIHTLLKQFFIKHDYKQKLPSIKSYLNRNGYKFSHGYLLGLMSQWSKKRYLRILGMEVRSMKSNYIYGNGGHGSVYSHNLSIGSKREQSAILAPIRSQSTLPSQKLKPKPPIPPSQAPSIPQPSQSLPASHSNPPNSGKLLTLYNKSTIYSYITSQLEQYYNLTGMAKELDMAYIRSISRRKMKENFLLEENINIAVGIMVVAGGNREIRGAVRNWVGRCEEYRALGRGKGKGNNQSNKRSVRVLSNHQESITKLEKNPRSKSISKQKQKQPQYSQPSIKPPPHPNRLTSPIPIPTKPNPNPNPKQKNLKTSIDLPIHQTQPTLQHQTHKNLNFNPAHLSQQLSKPDKCTERGGYGQNSSLCSLEGSKIKYMRGNVVGGGINFEMGGNRNGNGNRSSNSSNINYYSYNCNYSSSIINTTSNRIKIRLPTLSRSTQKQQPQQKQKQKQEPPNQKNNQNHKKIKYKPKQHSKSNQKSKSNSKSKSKQKQPRLSIQQSIRYSLRSEHHTEQSLLDSQHNKLQLYCQEVQVSAQVQVQVQAQKLPRFKLTQRQTIKSIISKNFLSNRQCHESQSQSQSYSQPYSEASVQPNSHHSPQLNQPVVTPLPPVVQHQIQQKKMMDCIDIRSLRKKTKALLRNFKTIQNY